MLMKISVLKKTLIPTDKADNETIGRYRTSILILWAHP